MSAAFLSEHLLRQFYLAYIVVDALGQSDTFLINGMKDEELIILCVEISPSRGHSSAILFDFILAAGEPLLR